MDETKEVAQKTVEAVASVAGGITAEARNLLHLEEVKDYFTVENVLSLLAGCIAIVIFYIAYRIIRKVVNNRVIKNAKSTTVTVVNKVMTYVFWILMLMHIMNMLGINLSAIWGAAGVAGLAIGFAAQTSVSNVISGVFVLSEKTMKIGDYISVDDNSGTVDSVGLLSVKIHTLDNQMIRIPNSSIINGTLTNYNHYSQRRLVFDLGVAYDSDIDAVEKALQTVPSLCPTVLADPAPSIYYDGLGENAINIKVCVWLKNSDFIKTKNDVCKAIVKVSRETPFKLAFNRLYVDLREQFEKNPQNIPVNCT